MSSSPRVLVVERRLPHYRVAFFEELRQALQQRGIALALRHGEPTAAERARRDEGTLDWAATLPVTRYALGGRVVWQPVATRGFDLVVASQGNGLLFNHWLLRPWRDHRFAFFDHGANLAAPHRRTLRERFKRLTTRRADWWFAYTQTSAQVVAASGFPTERITVVDNATDTVALRAAIDAVPEAERDALRARLGLQRGATALFLGSLYPGRGIELLPDTAALVRRADARFRLLVAGDGPLAPRVQAAADASGGVITALGARHGHDKAALLSVCDFVLLPRMVGLSIVDAFAAGLPLVTTTDGRHGPEIAYLDPEANGTMAAPSAAGCAQAVLRLLGDPALLARWRAGAARRGAGLSVQAMAARFADGVVRALASPRR